ncbi:MAG: DinB family protein [Bacteroidales bacterium]
MSAEKNTRYDFLVETYRTERLKTLSVWSQVPDSQLRFRPEARARSPLEHMVHQCVSEDTWMRTMLGIETSQAALPADESRLGLMRHYAMVSAERLAALALKPDEWFEEETSFFDVPRTRAWVMTRRIAHSAHHRGQLTVYLRLFGQALYSTYGPTADTGGLFQNHAPTIYRYGSVEELLEREAGGARWPPLPGAGERPPTERPD